MITLNFINKVHTAFNELYYHIDNNPNRDDFLTSAVDVIAHCYDLSFMLYHSYMQEIRSIRAYAAYRGIRV